MIAGRYSLDREVGRGGMGAVWLGTDQVLGRQVALKKIGRVPGDSQPDLVRAEREARLAARLNHPHVVAVYDLVEDGEDHWLVMEYIEGVTLAGLVKRDGALSPDEAAPLILQAADALAAAHAEGIVHRDVKPSNILVTQAGEVKLSDFGIARAEADATLTQTGLVTGSPAYLAPEVASGAVATDAADVWSLGATLFHALAGHPPYEVSDNVLGALYRIVHEEPPRLDDAGWLAPLLAHTMTREPADRWSMAQVREFLETGPSGVVVHPEPAVSQVDGQTQVMMVTPAEPMAVPPIVAEPDLAQEPAVPGRRAGVRRRSGSAFSTWLLLGLAAAVVVVIAVAIALTRGSGAGGDTPGALDPSSSRTSSSSSAPADKPTARGMEQFITEYASTAPGDPASSWKMLTPNFQRASHGFASYRDFWSQWTSAEVSDVQANPDDLSVSYHIVYTRGDGSTVPDDVSLTLAFVGGSYKIAAEG